LHAKTPRTDYGGPQDLSLFSGTTHALLSTEETDLVIISEAETLSIMRIRTTVLFTALLAVGSIASLPRLCAEGPHGSVAAESRDLSSCAARYNALIGQAKASLVKGEVEGFSDLPHKEIRKQFMILAQTGQTLAYTPLALVEIDL
jgi:hypothetical protein